MVGKNRSNVLIEVSTPPPNRTFFLLGRFVSAGEVNKVTLTAFVPAVVEVVATTTTTTTSSSTSGVWVGTQIRHIGGVGMDEP